MTIERTIQSLPLARLRITAAHRQHSIHKNESFFGCIINQINWHQLSKAFLWWRMSRVILSMRWIWFVQQKISQHRLRRPRKFDPCEHFIIQTYLQFWWNQFDYSLRRAELTRRLIRSEPKASVLKVKIKRKLLHEKRSQRYNIQT